MPRRCGIDTSILVRLATGEPARDFDHVVAALTHLMDQQPVERAEQRRGHLLMPTFSPMRDGFEASIGLQCGGFIRPPS